MLHYKQSITNLPVYKDGSFILYKILHAKTTYPQEEIEKVTEEEYFFEELSLSDTVMFENEKREKKIQKKIRIAQDRTITSRNVLEINNEYYKVFNIYHFKNKEGILQSDITLEEYSNAIIKGEYNE